MESREIIERCVELAEKTAALYQEGIVLNVSGIGEPSVLMQNKTFLELFPECNIGEWDVSDYDGREYRVDYARVGNVMFKCVEYREEDDGLGRA